MDLRSGLAALAGAAILVLAVLAERPSEAPPALDGTGREASATPLDAKPSAAVRTPGVGSPEAGATDEDGATASAEPAPISEPADPDSAPPGAAPPEAAPLVPVDLEALRAAMPDNLYWELGAPTEDPDVLERRAEDEQRRNHLFGKVQSGTATDEEMDRYQEERRRISEDYIAFSEAVLRAHGADLSDRDRGLFELAARMHRSRLAQLPRDMEAARAARRARDERRAQWHAKAP